MERQGLNLHLDDHLCDRHNLDDLTLLCEKDVEIIGKLEDGGKILQDVPDRIQLSAIDEFDDPDRVMVETLDCDIPKLNETLSSFRKGHAYLFIGGSGSGKTIIACQLACAFSYSQDRHRFLTAK